VQRHLSADSPEAAGRDRLIYALDYPDLDAAARGAEALRGAVGCVKVGLELFVRHGLEAVTLGSRANADVFLDLKLHDIPVTVERAVTSARALGVRFLTVHAAGGETMLRAAADSAGELTIVAVTVLTSLDAGDLSAVGFAERPVTLALRLGELAYGAGVRAFVCSPAEVGALRRSLGPEALLITPGVRPRGSAAGDQKRVATPADAIAAGADMLVVGRPIRDAAEPRAAAEAIAASIAGALAGR
jgi:orotidine-5'-phosphate decarboxylase